MKYIIGALGVVLLFVIGFFVFIQTGKENSSMNIDSAREVAEAWVVENAPTYIFDGFNLSLMREEVVEEAVEYSFSFSFDSRAAGYGNREGEVFAQVITPHSIEVVVKNGKVVSAITDEVFNEMIGEMLPEARAMKILVYFLKLEDTEVVAVPVIKEIPFTTDPARAALELLLAGVSEEEKSKGLSSAIPEGVTLQSIVIIGGVARADFDATLNEGVAGSMTVLAIREQIEKTLLQFDSVNEVIISVNGEKEEILQP